MWAFYVQKRVTDCVRGALHSLHPDTWKIKNLILFYMTLGHIDPDYHESACYYHIVRAKFIKIRDFVPFDICQDPVRLLLTFIFKIF